MSAPDAFLAWQASWDGYDERANNETVFAHIAGHKPNLAWCATFQVAAAKSTDTPLPPGADTAYTPAMWQAFVRAGRTVTAPAPGDLGFVFYRSLGRIGHVFAVREVSSASRVRTWEGNSNEESSRSGGSVRSLYRDFVTRGSAYVAGFARPTWDGQAVSLRNLPAKADHTGQIIAIPAVYTPVIASAVWRPGGRLVVDGSWGENTTRALQHALGVNVDGRFGPAFTKALQARINKATGARLKVDGVLGAKSIRAWQAWMGTPVDGVLSTPSSVLIRRVQERLNAGTF